MSFVSGNWWPPRLPLAQGPLKDLGPQHKDSGHPLPPRLSLVQGPLKDLGPKHKDSGCPLPSCLSLVQGPLKDLGPKQGEVIRKILATILENNYSQK
jgi:hypothetical protein